jgi:signal transduction histidine kinase
MTRPSLLQLLSLHESSGRRYSNAASIFPYLIAVLASALALYLRHALVPFIGESNPYLTVWLAVVFCSWYCGLGPSVLASVFCVVGVIYFFLPPFHSLAIESASERYGVLCFLLFSGVIVAFGESNRRAASFRRLAEEQLKAANDQLELRVDQRTAELQQKTKLLREQTETVKELSAQLLKLRDEERRRIARELHDSVGQLLAAVRMNFSKVDREKGKLSPEAAKSVDENTELIKQAMTEVRTMSHLLHPPLLDEIGLESAIRWFVEGFAQRSNIQVDLTLALSAERLADDLELAMFRIVQECLTNIHRHSGSKTARVHLIQRDGYVHCEVSDEGKGIPPERQTDLTSSGSTGVGLRGMRERVNQLGGTLQVHSNGKGTSVEANLPVRHIAASDITRGFSLL